MVSKQEQDRRVRDYRARQSMHDKRQRRLRRDSIIGTVAAAVVLLGGVGLLSLLPGASTDPAASTAPPTPGASDPAASVASEVPDPSLAEDRTWTGTLTLNGIDLGVELDGAAAPQAVSAVLFDTQRGYYDGGSCHRLTVSEGFSVLQCGSVDGQGSGDPAYMYGPIENAPEDDVYVEGTIAMARQGNNAESNGHQFFIVYGDTTIPSDTAGGYTVIGTVTSGLDELRSGITDAGTADGQPDGAPATPVTIDGFTLQ